MIGRSKQFLPQTKHQQLLFEKRLPNLETIHTLPPPQDLLLQAKYNYQGPRLLNRHLDLSK